LVQVEHALLGRDERRQGGCQLRHRRPAEDPLARAVRREQLPVSQYGDGNRLGRPRLDLSEGVHAQRYYEALLSGGTDLTYPRQCVGRLHRQGRYCLCGRRRQVGALAVERQLVPAKSPMAATVGYSRAIRVGPHVHVAGTAPIMPGEAEPPPDAYAQTKRILEIVVSALAELGADVEDVVRTRAYLVDG